MEAFWTGKMSRSCKYVSVSPFYHLLGPLSLAWLLQAIEVVNPSTPEELWEFPASEKKGL
jgi:hypothetical protein